MLVCKCFGLRDFEIRRQVRIESPKRLTGKQSRTIDGNRHVSRHVLDRLKRSDRLLESNTDRILKAEDLITAPAHVVMRAADEFRDKTTRPNELWQTDFTYLKVIGWGWFYLSTILDDYSRYIIAWKLCTTMKAGDVTDTLELALEASSCNQATVVQKPRLLSDNGSA